MDTKGTYIKVWNEQEDNVVMIEILESLENASYNTVYKSYKSNTIC